MMMIPSQSLSSHLSLIISQNKTDLDLEPQVLVRFNFHQVWDMDFSWGVVNEAKWYELTSRYQLEDTRGRIPFLTLCSILFHR